MGKYAFGVTLCEDILAISSAYFAIYGLKCGRGRIASKYGALALEKGFWDNGFITLVARPFRCCTGVSAFGGQGDMTAAVALAVSFDVRAASMSSIKGAMMAALVTGPGGGRGCFMN